MTQQSNESVPEVVQPSVEQPQESKGLGILGLAKAPVDSKVVDTPKEVEKPVEVQEAEKPKPNMDGLEATERRRIQSLSRKNQHLKAENEAWQKRFDEMNERLNALTNQTTPQKSREAFQTDEEYINHLVEEKANRVLEQKQLEEQKKHMQYQQYQAVEQSVANAYASNVELAKTVLHDYDAKLEANKDLELPGGVIPMIQRSGSSAPFVTYLLADDPNAVDALWNASEMGPETVRQELNNLSMIAIARYGNGARTATNVQSNVSKAKTTPMPDVNGGGAVMTGGIKPWLDPSLTSQQRIQARQEARAKGLLR